MKSALYTIKCLTNLHVGGGDINYSVLDNEVERDPVTGEPAIYASSLKGALRAHTVYQGAASSNIETWFGSDVKDPKKQDQKGSIPGKLKFLSANLLARPVRVSKGNAAYALATSKSLLMRHLELCESFEQTTQLTQEALQAIDTNCNYSNHPAIVEVEGIHVETSPKQASVFTQLEDLLGKENIVLLSDESMRKIDLPAVARNYLENGTSKNLWYEEFVPHESVFYTFILDLTGGGKLEELDSLLNNHQVVQFGGNASVGCGYTCMQRK